jgi:hypothetical protein
MKSPFRCIPIGWVLALCTAGGLSGCASPARPQTAAGATPLGAPRSPVSPRIIDQIDPPPSEGAPIRLPEQITLPATYRLLLLDGHLALVRESGATALPAAPASLRIVAGEITRGELAYQPALLPQELAAEVAANRDNSARLETALADVMQRSRELAAQTARLERQTRELAALLGSGVSAPRSAGASPGESRTTGGIPGGQTDQTTK